MNTQYGLIKTVYQRTALQKLTTFQEMTPSRRKLLYNCRTLMSTPQVLKSGLLNDARAFCVEILAKRKYSTSRESLVVSSPYPSIEIPKDSFTQLIWSQHEKWKHHTAVECGLSGENYTYSELLKRAEDIGQGLLSEGLKPGDVLAFLLPNTPDYIAAILGVAKVGLTICSINPLYTPNEISYQILNSGAKCLITFPDKLGDAIKAIEYLSSSGKMSTNITVISTKGLDGKEVQMPAQVKSLERIIKNKSLNKFPRYADHIQSNLAFISHSSGTTGLPKGVSLTHQNVTASILQMAYKPMTCFQETTNSFQDVIPMLLPIFHNFALEIALDALYHGAKIITLLKFEEESFLSTLKNHKATMLFVVPPVMLFLGSEKTKQDYMEYLRCIFCAAAPIGADDILRTLQKSSSNVNFVQGYGQTEAMCCLTYTPYGLKDYKSVGVPVVNTEMKIVDLENGTSKQPFEEGEICFRGPQMSLGYLNELQKTRETIDQNGWFHTGDVGYYDEDGKFYIVDRIKEMIKVKGFQVAPAELEAVLRNHPAVEDVGVIGIPDERKGEAPVAFIKMKPDAKISEKELKSFLSGKIAAFKMIDKFFFIDIIPKNPSGKILRKNLRSLLNS